MNISRNELTIPTTTYDGERILRLDMTNGDEIYVYDVTDVDEDFEDEVRFQLRRHFGATIARAWRGTYEDVTDLTE